MIAPLVDELCRLNHNVCCITHEKFRSFYKEDNIRFIYYNRDAVEESEDIFQKYKDVNPQFDHFNMQDLDWKRCLEVYRHTTSVNYEINTTFYHQVFEKIKEFAPDLIIRDTCAIWGKMAGKDLNTKTIAYICNPIVTKEFILHDVKQHYYNGYFPYVDLKEDQVPKLFEHFIAINRQLYSDYEIPFQYNFNPQEEFNLVFCSRELQPPHFYDTDKKVFFVRPKLFYNDKADVQKEKLIYVSTGSMIGAGLDFYNTVIQAFKDTEYQVLISFPYADEKELTYKLPSNVTIEKFVDQKKILERACLFISHGGYNSLYESIFYEVPLMIFPLVNDQFFNGDLVENTGIGINFKRHPFHSANVRHLAEQLIHSRIAHANLKYLSEDFKKSLSISEAAAIIEKNYAAK